MLEAIGLSRSYSNVRAQHALNLQAEVAQIFCQLGASGARKTTTTNLFLKFIGASSGDARVNGLNFAEHSLETKKHLGCIPEQAMLDRNLTGLENLEYFAALAGNWEYPKAQLRQFLVDAELPAEAVDRRDPTCSKGMRQRVGIAIAVARKAQALLIGEQTSGLDPKVANEFANRLDANRLSSVAQPFERSIDQRVGNLLDLLGHADRTSRLHAALSRASLSWAELDTVEARDEDFAREAVARDEELRIVVRRLREVDQSMIPRPNIVAWSHPVP